MFGFIAINLMRVRCVSIFLLIVAFRPFHAQQVVVVLTGGCADWVRCIRDAIVYAWAAQNEPQVCCGSQWLCSVLPTIRLFWCISLFHAGAESGGREVKKPCDD